MKEDCVKKDIWIFAEQNHGVVASSFYEILSKIDDVYSALGGNHILTAVILGAPDAARELKNSGADRVISVVNDTLASYNPQLYTQALADLAMERKPDLFFIAASGIGSEVAPGVAARLNTGLDAHCTDLRLDQDGVLHMITPAFGGKLMSEIVIPRSRPVMASVKPGVFDRTALQPKDAEVQEIHMEGLDAHGHGVALIAEEMAEMSEIPIEAAEVAVCAGLGAAASGNLEKVKKFAAGIGASMCYTRPLSDLGYYPNESAMVGTSGKTIKPKLYIGFGVSGEGQHACGMKDSGMIINVNSDDAAMCFDISNYKIVGDCGAVLDELLAALQI